METIFISAFIGSVLFAIGFACGKCSPCHHDFNCDMYEIRLGKLGSLETKAYMLEQDNNRLQHIYESLTREKRMWGEYYAAHCARCDRTFYGKSPKEQEVADLLKKIDTSKSVEELAKKLDIDIRF